MVVEETTWGEEEVSNGKGKRKVLAVVEEMAQSAEKRDHAGKPVGTETRNP